jgi:flagellar hook assembly protein FlgD
MLPAAYELKQNFPNPFNPSTTILYALPRQSHVVLTIYDILGREVVRLLDETQEPGSKSVMWNGRNAAGSSVSSGAYFYMLEAASDESAERFAQVRRLMVLK